MTTASLPPPTTPAARPSLQSKILRLGVRLMGLGLAGAGGLSVGALRAFVRTGAAATRLPFGARTRRQTAGGVPALWMRLPQAGPGPVILYLHGGGFILGWARPQLGMLARICRAAGARALAVDYRLAPEHAFPAPLDDCLAAYRWLLNRGVHPEHLVILGDSAGGTLTLATLLALRDAGDPLPAAGVCLSPATDLTGAGETLRSNAGRDAVLRPALAEVMGRAYLANQDATDPLISPLYGDFHGLPPLLIQAGSDELLLSDATRLADRARAAGVDVTLSIWPGMWHVWHIFAPWLPEARRAIAEAGSYIIRNTRAAPLTRTTAPAPH